MSNLAGKAYAINVLTPMKAGTAWFSKLLFRIGRTQPWTMTRLRGLGLIQFAHWAMIRRDQWPQLGQPKADLKNNYMLFCSNFNGSWDQYVVAFTDSIPDQLDTFWYTAVRYPRSIPFSPAARYITANTLHTDYYYNAAPGSGLREIKACLRIGHDLRALELNADQFNDKELGEQFQALLRENQNGLAAPGFAPPASPATAAADRNRAHAISHGVQVGNPDA